MQFKNLVLERFSCRDYLPKEVPDELINELFETCRFAPSAANYQPWEFIVVTQKDQLTRVHQSYRGFWLQSAPVIIIALADVDNAWVRYDGKNHSDIDLAIFIDHFTLAATEKGLATCWVCHFNVESIIKSFSLPANKVPIALIPLGFPANPNNTVKKRKAVNDFVFINNYPNDRV